MCGNGIRCLAKFIADLEGNVEVNKSYRIDTLAGLIVPKLETNGEVTVDMEAFLNCQQSKFRLLLIVLMVK